MLKLIPVKCCKPVKFVPTNNSSLKIPVSVLECTLPNLALLITSVIMLWWINNYSEVCGWNTATISIMH